MSRESPFQFRNEPEGSLAAQQLPTSSTAGLPSVGPRRSGPAASLAPRRATGLWICGQLRIARATSSPALPRYALRKILLYLLYVVVLQHTIFRSFGDGGATPYIVTTSAGVDSALRYPLGAWRSGIKRYQ